MQEREKVRQLSKGDIEKTISLAKEICSIKDSIKEVAEVLRLCVQCPYCGTGISRVSGCNSMVCGNLWPAIFAMAVGWWAAMAVARQGVHSSLYVSWFLNYGLSSMLSSIYFLDANSEI
jgi:hypothetical protein